MRGTMMGRCLFWLIWLAGTLAGPALANEPAPVVSDASPCGSIPQVRTPQYPPTLMREKRKGRVVLDLRVDDCGRVTAVEVVESTRREFNEAAIASVEGRRLNDARRARVVDDHVRMEIEFTAPRDVTPAPLDWPTTHARPRYEADTTPLGFDTPAQANEGIDNPDGRMWLTPFRVVGSRFVQIGEPGQRMFWYFLSRDGEPKLAVRYRPMMEEGVAVVRVGVLCADTEVQCARTREVMLAQGLPGYPPAQR